MVAVYSLFYRHWCMGNNHFSGTANCQNKKTGCYRIVETILTKSMDNSILSLLEKYDVPTPRYTSYPTVPYWDFLTINESKWKQSVITVSYTHLRAHETRHDLVCRLLLE